MSKIQITGGSHSMPSWSEELMPCPFCLNTEHEMIWEKCERVSEDDTDRLWWIECCYCGACGPRSNTEPEAIDRWNTRAQTPRRPMWPEREKNPLGKDSDEPA